MTTTAAPDPKLVTIQGIPAGADDLGQQEFDFLATSKACSIDAGEDCEACQ